MLRNTKRIGLMFILALVPLALITPVFAASSDADVGVSGGTRSVSLGSLSFGQINYSHDNQTKTSSVNLTVDDSTGSDLGWNVTVQATDFTDGDRVIPASNFVISSAGKPAASSGQAIGGSGPFAGETGSLDSPRKVLLAEPGAGKGTYNQTLNLKLTIPGQSLAGSYSSSLTATISAGP